MSQGTGSKAQESWTAKLPTIGTFSSPRVADLNNDGTKDIILGGGRLEFQACDTAMFALDGKTGKLLWNVSSVDQIYGSAGLLDIDQDGVLDPILSGRSSELKAISGASGKVIWAFDTIVYSNNGLKRWFNFYNPQFIHDLDGDGLKDIIVSNGGDILVKPYDENRAAGRMVIISSKNGKLLAAAEMPDKREIYQSIVVEMNESYPLRSKIYFGTGGETVDGSFFKGTLAMVIDGDLSKAKKFAIGEGKGFIGPPSLLDLNQDGVLDLVILSVNGRVIAFDGVNDEIIWEAKIEDTEAYSSFGIGYFTNDSIPDLFLSVAQGIWPDLSWTKQAMINGKNGKIEFTDSLGFYQTSSPLAADLDGDGLDEVILSVDFQILDDLGRKSFYNTLYAIKFESNEVIPMIESIPGHNVSSTPWLGDLDGDGMLDIVFCHSTNMYQTYTFDGMQVNCLKTTIPIKKPIKWGSYMGSDGDGIFRK